MMSRRLTYLTGPILVAVIGACAEPVSPEQEQLHLMIDTASSQALEAAPAALDKLFSCQASGLIIAYAFGDIRFTAHAGPNAQCLVTVSSQDELGESPRPAAIPCPLEALAGVDWLYEDGELRDAPPSLSTVCRGE